MGAVAFALFVSGEAAALKRSRSQIVLGPIWVTLGTQAFPRTGWRDCPVAALASWTNRCLKLQAVGDEALLNFLEGEFRIRVEQIEDQLVQITAITEGVDGATCITSKAHLWNELARAGHLVLSQCSTLGWPSAEWNQLRDNLDAHRHPAPRN